MTASSPQRRLCLCAFVSVCLGAGVAAAGGTKALRVTSYREFEEADTKGVLISSQGELLTGNATRKVEIKVPFVRSAVTAPDGTIYLGTGDQGELWAFERGALRKVAKVDTPVISALALGPGGTIYCGTVADGRVLAVDPRTGTWKQVAQLDKKGETHIWALVYDQKRNVLWAGTGPKGLLFAVDGAGQARQVWDSSEKQLLSLQLAGDGSGALYVGSGERAILFRVDLTGRARVLHSFAADEVHAIRERSGSLYIVVNEFTGGGGAPGLGGTRIAVGTGPTPPQKAPLPRMGTRAGKGAVYRWDPDGRIEQLFALGETWFADLWVDPTTLDVYAAAGGQGRVYLIKPDRTSFTAYEFPERQVLVMELKGPVRLFGTGDPGVVHVAEAGPPKVAQFTSKVLDAGYLARFGHLRWNGRGKIQFETRSGNTAKPDKTWSGWNTIDRVTAAGDLGTGLVKSPESRYLQFRVLLGSERALVRSLTLYYLPQNQRPRLTEVTVGEPKPAGVGLGVGGAAGAPRPHSTMVKIRWKADNPDNDELTYRLFVREEGDPVWKPLGGPEPLTKTEFDWQTEAVPDGHYLARVVVTDEKANPKDRALTHELVSAQSYLVDNRKPDVLGLEVRYPFLSGRARDSYSVLTDLAYSIDGGDWVPFYPSDGIFDDPVKTFTVRLPDNLTSGQHTVAVRTSDEADNVGSAQATFRVNK
jgi:hypothetical protein